MTDSPLGEDGVCTCDSHPSFYCYRRHKCHNDCCRSFANARRAEERHRKRNRERVAKEIRRIVRDRPGAPLPPAEIERLRRLAAGTAGIR